MRKFFILLKKELRELVTLQLIVPLLLTVLFFMGIGNVLSNEQKKAASSKPVVVLDQDGTATSGSVTELLGKANFTVTKQEGEVPAALDKAREIKAVGVIVIPKGFEAGISAQKPVPVEAYNILSNFSIVGIQGAAGIQGALSAVNSGLSTQLIASQSGSDPEFVKNPVPVTNHVVIKDKQAVADPSAVMGFVSQQTTFIPIVLFFVITFAAQMIGTAIATEKENKTLETLLSLPVSRQAIVSAKMLAAALIALLMSGFYMIGFRSYINGVSGGATTGLGEQVSQQLGLHLTVENYLLLGTTMFVAILGILAIALILGAFAEDVKSLQGLMAPLMILLLIPYMLSLFIDPATASPAIRYLLYAIPFSHAFLAGSNIFLHNYSAIWWGILYELATFVVFVFIAAKIFSTDRIITMKLKLKKKGS